LIGLVVEAPGKEIVESDDVMKLRIIDNTSVAGNAI
jgi:hypothetical protein